jgi:acetyl esterase
MNPMSIVMSTPPLTRPMSDVLDGIRRANRAPFHTLTPKQARIAYEAASEVLELPRVPLPRIEDFDMRASGKRSMRARLYAPPGDVLPTLLHLHGGGFTIGNLETHDSLCRQLAARSGCAVVALDYRLAPEHRFPAAVDDAWAALEWLSEHAAMAGLDAARLAVAGDSAGGTLAAVCAIHARDVGIDLALQVLITPGTAALQDSASHRMFGSGYLLESAGIEWFFDQYLDPRERHDWRFAPLEAEDLDGVAPALMVLAECDPLVDEGIAYADRLRAAAVAVELELYRGLTHDFIKMGRAIPEAAHAQAAISAALKKAFER